MRLRIEVIDGTDTELHLEINGIRFCFGKRPESLKSLKILKAELDQILTAAPDDAAVWLYKNLRQVGGPIS